MTASDVASILVGVREMPCVCYYSQIDYPEGVPPGRGFIFWTATVPSGKKLIVKKCGVTSYGFDPEPDETVVIVENRTIEYVYRGVYNEPNLEFSSGTEVRFMIKNAGTSGEYMRFGAWVMFDFVTE